MMRNGEHWNEDELLLHLYDASDSSPEALSHLMSCADCHARWQELRQARQTVLQAAAPAGDARLRQQREELWRRIEEPPRGWVWRVAPLAATACLLVVAVMLHQTPAPVPGPVEVTQSWTSDSQFFEEVASMAFDEVPRAADPIRSLFDQPVEGNTP